MKFMLKGLDLRDWKRVSTELVGDDNIYIFGKHRMKSIKLYETQGYVARDYWRHDAIRPLVDFIVSDKMCQQWGTKNASNRLHHELISKRLVQGLNRLGRIHSS